MNDDNEITIQAQDVAWSSDQLASHVLLQKIWNQLYEQQNSWCFIFAWKHFSEEKLHL